MATAVTAKTINTSRVVLTKPISAVAAAQTETNATHLVQKQGLAGKEPNSGNPPQGFSDPSPSLPSVNRPSDESLTPGTPAERTAILNQTLGLVSKEAAVQTLLGGGTGTAQSERDALTDLPGSTVRHDTPAFDQGFTGKPVNLASDPLTLLNPMDPFRGGSVGGPLGTAAADDPNHNGNGIAGQGIGAVSDEPNDPDGKPIEVEIDYTDLAIEAVAAVAKKILDVKFRSPENVAVWVVKKTLKDAVNEGQYNYEEKKNKESADEAARQAELDWVKAREAYLIKQLRKNDKGPAGKPDPENTGKDINILSQPILDQLKASNAGKPASQGGGGDVMPVSEEGVNPVVRNGTIAVNESSVRGQNLFGQPVNPAFDNVSGGNGGLNGFDNSNGAGVINPGNEAGSPGGDVRFQQDPAKAVGGNKPAPAGPSMPASPGSPSEQSSSVSTTLAAGVRDLTLTGTAAINGTGNALDNQITGNRAANELRGEAGNDKLSGQGGRDLLDGGSGRDLLTGGTGADRFRFAGSGGFGSNLADRITDFRASEGDRIEISRQAFGLAPNTTATVVTARNDAELNQMLASGNTFVLDQRDGSLQFNQNGSAAGAGSGGVFAVVSSGLTLQAADFTLVA